MTLFQPPEPPDQIPPYGAVPPMPAQPAPAGYPYVRQQWPTDQWGMPLQPAPALGPRERWRADRVVSIVFLSLGLLGAIAGVVTAILLPLAIQSIYDRRGEGFFESTGNGHLLALLFWSHIVLFVAALAVTVLLLRRRKPAFYVPLAAGVIAAVIYWVVLISYLSADHTMQFVA